MGSVPRAKSKLMGPLGSDLPGIRERIIMTANGNSTYYAANTLLYFLLHILICLPGISALSGTFYYPHFAYKKTEVQRGELNCPICVLPTTLNKCLTSELLK